MKKEILETLFWAVFNLIVILFMLVYTVYSFLYSTASPEIGFNFMVLFIIVELTSMKMHKYGM